MTDQTIELPKIGYQKLEWALILLGLALTTTSAFLFFGDLTLRELILGWQNTENLDPVGVLAQTDGTTRRKGANVSEFLKVGTKSVLYNYDTLVTGDDTTATIQLDDGGTIELGPKTMIKLAFESRLSLGGISRAARVNVVSGRVQGKTGVTAKASSIVLTTAGKTITLEKSKPKQAIQAETPNPVTILKKIEAPVVAKVVPPPPPPVVVAPPRIVEATLELIYPKKGAVIAPDPNGEGISKVVDFKWKQKPADRAVMLKIRKGDTELLNTEVEPKLLSGSKEIFHSYYLLKQPGTYEWSISTIEPKPDENIKMEPKSVSGQFKLDSLLVGIETLSPLIGGKNVNSNIYTGKHLKDFDITFRWRPVADAKNYTIKLYKNKNETRKPTLQFTVDDPRYVLTSRKAFVGKLYYSISAPLKSGFVATSKLETFEFNFLPPVLVSPQNGAQVTDQKILFTWQKTNFTESYEIEFSKSKTFESIIYTAGSRSNFMAYSGLKPGTYFWRVRSRSKNAVSPYTPAFEFSIAP